MLTSTAFAEVSPGIYRVRLAGHFANQEFGFDEAHIQTNDTSSDVNSVDGLVISSGGELSFTTLITLLMPNLVSGDIVYIDASYQVTNY